MAVNARTEEFQHIEVFDKPALFTNGRIARDTVPKGWYCYDIRGSDDDPGELCYMEENVVVNHAGSVLMPEKLVMPKSGRLDVRDELGFLNEGDMTLREFCETHQLPYPTENMKFHIRPARPEEAGLFYTPHPEEDKRLGTVGHVRMDFGRSGNEFWHTWWPRGPEELNSPAFKLELQEVVDTLRESVLKSRFAMERFCYEHGGKISGGWTQNYGYIVETEHYRYCLRCNPSPGDYNGYLTAYDLDVQRQNMARDKPLVGRVSYANGDAQEFTDAEAFLKCAREELPYRPTTGFRYEVLTDDPSVRRQVDDMIFDLYGEEAPLPAGGSRASVRAGHDLRWNVMDASKKQREPVAFKSLAELKRFIRPGVEFKTVSHANHADMVGLTRVVTTVQTVGFYSKIKDQPEHPFSTCNHGKGFYTDFGKAGNYIFDGTTVKVKDTRKQDRGVIYELEFYDREQNMEETMMDRKMVNFIKEQYPPGTRIRLNSMDDPYAPILPGTEGEVDFVDDAGQLHMKWDNGRTLPLAPGEDSFTVLPPKLTTLKLYMPLTADLYERNEYGDFDDSSTLLEGSELRGYQDQITAALVKNRMPEETERGLMHWYDEADSVDRKVRSAVFTVEQRDRQLWGVAECRVAGELSDTELETLKEYLTGQASDGWGEGFEQREISVDDGGKLYVHLWNSDEWSIQTEQELFAPKLADGLPELCFSTLPGTGELICIKRGESGYYPSDWNTNDPAHNREIADYNNERLGVTQEQRLAMECGSMHGWGVPGADPACYEQKQEMGGMTLG